jgi:hypothetical protein
MLSGCGKPADPETTPAAPRPALLKLLVVDDSPLAKQIARVKGEWKARSGADLEIRETTSAELESTKLLAADTVIYPAAAARMAGPRRFSRG